MKNPFAGTGLRRYTRQHLIHDRDAARAEVLRLEAVIRELDATVIEQGNRISQLEADAVDVGVERQLREAAEQLADALTVRLRAFDAQVANENAITLPPMQPIDPDETVPGGFDVTTLREALNPVGA